MSTDSGNEESGESNQQSEKTRKGKGFLSIIVFLIAVVGVSLIVVSMQGPTIPQIEGYGGNQNPFVGIPNVAIAAFGIFGTIFFLFAGGMLLVVAFVVYLISKSARPLRNFACIFAFVFVVIAIVFATETIEDNKQDSERIHFANILGGHDIDKWRRPHAPGPFEDYYDSGEKAVEGQYDVNKKMSGLWTQWRVTGEVAGQQIYVDGLLDGTVRSWPPGHVRPNESVYRFGQRLHSASFFADGSIEQESNYTVGEDGKPHSSTTGWYESGEVRFQMSHINGVLHSATNWYENGQKKSETFPTLSNQFLVERSWSASGVAVPCEGRGALHDNVYCID